MIPIAQNELVILRHAPADHGGRLCGRTDITASLPGDDVLGALHGMLTDCEVVVSPARRCRQTAEALFPGRGHAQDERLWEQDFGGDEGRPFGELPDLGPLSLDALARHASHGGESFLDMVGRVEPALREIANQVRAVGPTLVVAHAGTARAGLGLALGHPALGLKFEVAPLSLTRLRCLNDGFSVVAANQCLPL